MKIKVHVTTGYVGCEQRSEIEIPDSELEYLTEQEKEEVYSEYTKDWMYEQIEWGWEVIE